jgi:ferredoxin
VPDKTAIWIDEGCIQCGWCQNLEPAVFFVSEEGCVIRAEARRDDIQGTNREEQSRLRPGVLDSDGVSFMRFIADGCPVQVIKLSADVPEAVLLENL